MVHSGGRSTIGGWNIERTKSPIITEAVNQVIDLSKSSGILRIDNFVDVWRTGRISDFLHSIWRRRSGSGLKRRRFQRTRKINGA